MKLKIGNLEIENNLILAPMAGVSNSAFREIARECGAGLTYAEMVSDKEFYIIIKKQKISYTVQKKNILMLNKYSVAISTL